MKKRNISKLLAHVLLAAVILIASLLVTSCSAKFEYELSSEEGGFVISSYNGNKANLVIPSEYSGLPVIGIADEVFEGNTRIKSVEIPSSVTKLGGKAFANCTNLKTVYLPEKMDVIGFGCFSECTALESVVIPEGIKELVSAEFLKCTSLKSVTIPSSIGSVFYTAFMGCENLEEINVASGNKTYISVDNCLIDKERKELVIGTSNSVIPTDGSVTSICDGAFYDRKSLSEITIPESVDTIGEVAFYGCSSLNSIKALGASKIGIRAFYGCSSASYALLSDKLTKIEDYAFLACTSLKNIYFEGNSEKWEAVEISTEKDTDFLSKITVSFYSETAPAGEGSFWRFDGSTPTLWN